MKLEMKNNNPVIEFKDIHFSYSKDTPILKGVTFNIYPNEYVCIIGHNGSGKSTISKILAGLLKPQKGEIKLFGETISASNVKHLRNNIGIVFQNPDNQFVGLTVEDDIAFGLENRKVPPQEMPKIIELAAQAIGIKDLLKKEPNDLSGGQKQKVAIAGILAINPEVIIFDESTSMLDPKGKRELKQLILDLKNKTRKTIISITHDMEEVINADKVIIINGGIVHAMGTPKDVFLYQDQLEKLKLDYPFILKLTKELKTQGVDVMPTLDENEFLKWWKQKK